MTGAGQSRRTALAGGLALGLMGAAAPHRVVSLNPCLDAILVHVADRRQIAALSHYSRDPHGSLIAGIAAGLPMTYETAEEVMGLSADLVLTSRHSSAATRRALERMKIRTELFDVPDTVADSDAQIRRIASLVGREARGEALISRIHAAIAASRPAPGRAPLSAIIYQPNGFAAGTGTLIDAMMREAGLQNVAGRYGLSKWGQIPLERLIADPPQVILAGEVAPGTPTWADRVLTHPALARLSHRVRKVSFPQRLLYCGGPTLIETAAVLRAARGQG